MKNFEAPELSSASAAVKLLAQVKPCTSWAIPLLEPPAVYLGRLYKQLAAIAAGNIGGVAPIQSKWIQELEDVLRTFLRTN